MRKARIFVAQNSTVAALFLDFLQMSGRLDKVQATRAIIQHRAIAAHQFF